MADSNFQDITAENAYKTAKALAEKQTPRGNGPFSPPQATASNGMLDVGPTRPDLQKSVYFSSADPKTTANTDNEHTQERALEPQNRPSPHYSPQSTPSAAPELKR